MSWMVNVNAGGDEGVKRLTTRFTILMQAVAEVVEEFEEVEEIEEFEEIEEVESEE